VNWEVRSELFNGFKNKLIASTPFSQNRGCDRSRTVHLFKETKHTDNVSDSTDRHLEAYSELSNGTKMEVQHSADQPKIVTLVPKGVLHDHSLLSREWEEIFSCGFRC
jgi:hypothetical protein